MNLTVIVIIALVIGTIWYFTMYKKSSSSSATIKEKYVVDTSASPVDVYCPYDGDMSKYFKCLCNKRNTILKGCSSYKLGVDTTQDRLNKYLGCNDASLSDDEKHSCFKDPVSFLCTEPHYSSIEKGFACRQAVAGALEDCDLSFDAGLCKICQSDADCKDLDGATCNFVDEEIRKVHDVGFGECTYSSPPPGPPQVVPVPQQPSVLSTQIKLMPKA